MKRKFIATSIAVILVGTLLTTIAWTQNRIPSATGESVTIEHDDLEREYRIHIPDSLDRDQPAPLVLFLHGGGGNSKQISRIGMSDTADKNGFIVIYPNGIDKHWNDGRDAEQFEDHHNSIDDVGFINAVVEKVKTQHKIDDDRIYVCGVSNGGFMTQRLAMEHSETYSAVGIVVASMPESLREKFEPSLPVSIAFINGTDDPLVPYNGGEVGLNLTPRFNQRRDRKPKSRGFCVATEDAVKMWVQRNGITAEPTVSLLEDIDNEDGCHVELSLWDGGDRSTTVALYKVLGGGHTVPGGKQNFPERLVGKVNQDINACDVLWNFFQNHSREN